MKKIMAAFRKTKLVRILQPSKEYLAIVIGVVSLAGWYLLAQSLAYSTCGQRVKPGGTVYFGVSRLGEYREPFKAAVSQWNGKANVKVAFTNSTGKSLGGSSSSTALIPVQIVDKDPYTRYDGKSANRSFCPNSGDAGMYLLRSTLQSPNSARFRSVAIHESGHALGLNHTDVYYAIMNISYRNSERGSNPVTNIQSDDINGLRRLYPGSSNSSSGNPGSGSSSSSVNSCQYVGPGNDGLPRNPYSGGSHVSWKPGVSGTCIKHLQWYLTRFYHFTNDRAKHGTGKAESGYNPGGIHGRYDEGTRRAVAYFQGKFGLSGGGTMNSSTWSKIHSVCASLRRSWSDGSRYCGYR